MTHQITLTGLALILLTACAAPNTTTSATPAADASSAEWVVPSYVKPGLPVEIAHIAPSSVAAGEPATVELRITAAPNTDVLLDIASSTGLDVLSAGRMRMRTDADGVALGQLRVASPVEGRHYVDVTAMMDTASEIRVVSIPVQIGQGGVVGKITPGRVETAPDGTRRVIMGAEETINGRPSETTEIGDE